VKQRVDALCKAAVGQPALDQNSIHAKAQFISQSEVFTCILYGISRNNLNPAGSIKCRNA
jgi:hypothetical protein